MLEVDSALQELSEDQFSFNMIVEQFIIFLLFFRYAQAQFIQRYNDVNGVPHWRRQIANAIPNLPVRQPTYPVILEYNCAFLPSICINARAWMSDPALSNWPGRAGPDVFTYDIHAGAVEKYSIGTYSRSFKSNGDHR
jgi:hypothetical protein